MLRTTAKAKEKLEGMVFDHKKNHNMLVEADIMDKILDRQNFMLYLNDISTAHKVKYRKQLHDSIKRFDKEFDREGLNQNSTIVWAPLATSFNQ
jgi:hypothetical protein